MLTVKYQLVEPSSIQCTPYEQQKPRKLFIPTSRRKSPYEASSRISCSIDIYYQTSRSAATTAAAAAKMTTMTTGTGNDDSKTIYQLSFYTPPEHTQSILSALHKNTSAGTWPNPSSHPDASSPPKYRDVAFVTRGTGQFRPTEHASPHIGKPGALEVLAEDKVEIVVAGKEAVRLAVEQLKAVHPYEVVAFFVVKCETEFY